MIKEIFGVDNGIRNMANTINNNVFLYTTKTKIIPVWLKKETERKQQELLDIGPLWWEILKRIFAL